MAMGFGLAVMAGGIAMDTLGQFNQGKALKQQAEAEQDILNYNASIKDREAKAAAERGRAEALKFQKEGEQLQAGQQVAIAKGGVLSSTGTPALLMEDTANELEADRQSILREGFLNQSTLQEQAKGLRFEGRAARARGRNVKTASDIRTATTLLTGMKRFGAAAGMGG